MLIWGQSCEGSVHLTWVVRRGSTEQHCSLTLLHKDGLSLLRGERIQDYRVDERQRRETERGRRGVGRRKGGTGMKRVRQGEGEKIAPINKLNQSTFRPFYILL